MARKIKERMRKMARKEIIGKALKDEIIAGAIVGVVNNVIHGRAPIDFSTAMQKATRMDLTNPLIFIVLGKILKIPALGAIGAFRLVNPANPLINLQNEIVDEMYMNEQQIYLR